MEKKKLIEDIYPLSAVQEGILYNTLEAEEAGMYFSQNIFEIEGVLDLNLLRRAVEEVIAHHGILRSSFIWEGRESPVQVVLSKVRLPWQQHDLRAFDRDERERRFQEFLAEDRDRGFELNKPPLLRVAAMQMSDSRTLLIWSYHHILLDGWSLVLLLRQLSSCYVRLDNGLAVEAYSGRQFGDYIAWLKGRDLSRAEEFWRELLKGFEAPTPLPLLHKFDSPGHGERYPQQTFLLSSEQTLALTSFARQHNLTVNTLVQGAWALLLARHSGTEDVVFGVAMSGRPPELEGAEEIVGLFINTLPMRVGSNADDQLLPWLAGLQRQQAEARQHEHSPMREVHGWSEVPGSKPLFESFINFQSFSNEKQGASQEDGLTVVSQRSIIEASYPLALVAHLEARLNLAIAYDSERIDESSVVRLQHQLKTLLDAFVDRPESVLKDVPLLPRAEVHQVVHGWNAQSEPLAEQTFSELFELVVQAEPKALALVGENNSLTYGELNQQVNQLAHYLSGLGVGPETVVALSLERSVEGIVALLAVLKAGGAYLALEPSHPPKRQRSIVEQAGARILITRDRTLDDFDGLDVQLVDLGADKAGIAAESGDKPTPSALPSNLAYVLFTSGSTGQPKGVAIEHRQLTHYVAAVRDALDLRPGMSFALVSTLAADLGNTCLYPALLSGGCLHVVSHDRAMDPDGMAEFGRQHDIDCLKIVISHLNAQLNASRPKDVLPRERLILGGEASSWQDIDRLMAVAPDCRIYNHYGPTESTVGVCTYDLRQQKDWHRNCAGVPLGRPLPRGRIYILDSDGRLAPQGAIGEIAIGGSGLARGYLGDPRSTAERFGPDPFSEDGELDERSDSLGGHRIYRTGDLARWLPDGNLEFLGRVDHQVKIRGFRVELGEIEAVLRQHPDVDGAVATVSDATDVSQLVAYVSTSTSSNGNGHGDLGDGQYRLPNGLVCFHQHEHETRALYEDIFVQRNYLKHGVALPEKGCVVDVGANIGLFSLFVRHHRPDLPIYAFEPVQPVFDVLRSNAGEHSGFSVFPYGLADQEKTEELVFYPFQSTQSGLAALADTEDDVAAIRAVLSNREAGAGSSAIKESDLDTETLGVSFESRELSGRFERLSTVLQREGIERVGLLKIDVQRAELEVLAGIEDADWQKIDQVVVEVHNRADGDDEGGVEKVVGLLEKQGFTTTVEQDEALVGTDRYNVYAVRAGVRAPSDPQGLSDGLTTEVSEKPVFSVEGLRSFLTERLPEPMVPSSIVLLDQLPLSPNGKVDRSKLPNPETAALSSRDASPRSPLEQRLADVWSDVLGVEEIGVEDNFFDLGGHSLRAMQLITRLRRDFAVELSLREFLSAPTIASLALIIAQKSAEKLESEDIARILQELDAMPGESTSSLQEE